MDTIKIIQIGLGPLGQKITKYILERRGLEIVGAVDPAPDKAGKDLGELCSINKLGIQISKSLDAVIGNSKPDVALLTTVSDMERITPQIEEILSYKIPIVSTCEELSFPWETSPELAKRIDEAAKSHNVSVLGTGVNPGFLMDFLPIAMTGVCQDVKSIKVSRIQDASFRRIPFQKKIGAGLTLKEFEEKRKAGTLRHVGLRESMHMIASKMGWKLSRTEDILTPVIAEHDIRTDVMKISNGMARGVQQIGKGYVNGEQLITLEFRAAIGEKNSHDTIQIKGTPDINSTIEGGINGDIATCAVTINAIKSILDTTPGLKTMADVPVVSFFDSLERIS
ncbi:dihydrodipicolinate reductase [bacterium]|nr:dihydrodipicolinate reductase [bacterium]